MTGDFTNVGSNDEYIPIFEVLRLTGTVNFGEGNGVVRHNMPNLNENLSRIWLCLCKRRWDNEATFPASKG